MNVIYIILNYANKFRIHVYTYIAYRANKFKLINQEVINEPNLKQKFKFPVRKSRRTLQDSSINFVSSRRTTQDSAIDFVNSKKNSLEKCSKKCSLEKCSNEQHEIQEFDAISNVCICMIDIVGFSLWCSNQIPQMVAFVMISYNDIICEILKRYSSLNKIELVGDCCMIVARSESSTNSNEFGKISKEIIDFAEDLLYKMNDIQELFKSKEIGLRIGLHLGDVIGLYIKNPLKYQLFSNDINICSRLEASAIKNTIHVSDKLLFVASHCNAYSINRKFKTSEKIHAEYKGVGFKLCSYMLHIKKNEILFMNFDKNIKTKLPILLNCSTYIFRNGNNAIDHYLSYSYNFTCLNMCNTINNCEMEQLLHEWNSIKKSNIEIILCCNDNQLSYLKENLLLRFDGIYNINTLSFKHDFEQVCNEYYHVF